MFGKKGISPLIASVILIAFVIAVAGIASTFFTGFTKEQKAAAESKGTTVVDCSDAVLNLDEDTVSINTTEQSFSLVVSNTWSSTFDGLRVIVFNSSAAGTCIPSPTSVDSGETVTLTNSSCANMPSGLVSKIQVTTTTCAGIKSELTNNSVDSSGNTVWKVTA